MEITVGMIAERIGAEVIGDAHTLITGVSGLTEANPGDISFLADEKYLPLLAESKASAVLVAQAVDHAPCAQLIIADPNLAFVDIVNTYANNAAPRDRGIHDSAIIGNDVTLGDNISIGAHAVIEDGAVIGDNSVIYPQAFIGSKVLIGTDCIVYPQVTIRESCELGNRVIIHAGTVIGGDGFGYATVEGVHHKIPQIGNVVIGNDVEIGANTCIDRARFGKTIIGDGSKIDNLVQIAHNVEFGEHCIVTSQAGIAGSAQIGNYVTFAGKSGSVGHITIGDGAIIAGMSGATKNVPAKHVIMGLGLDVHKYRSQDVALRRLPRTLKSLKQMENRLAELEQKLAQMEQQADE